MGDRMGGRRRDRMGDRMGGRLGGQMRDRMGGWFDHLCSCNW